MQGWWTFKWRRSLRLLLKFCAEVAISRHILISLDTTSPSIKGAEHYFHAWDPASRVCSIIVLLNKAFENEQRQTFLRSFWHLKSLPNLKIVKRPAEVGNDKRGRQKWIRFCREYDDDSSIGCSKIFNSFINPLWTVLPDIKPVASRCSLLFVSSCLLPVHQRYTRFC